jgi:bifunctional non-homologous end joining protein LigD
MLATALDATSTARIPLQDPSLWYELKYDGIRALVSIEPGHPLPGVRLWSRNGNEKTAQFPDLVKAVQEMARGLRKPLLLDGEIVALDEHGEPAGFQRLQGRMHLTDTREIARQARTQPVALLVFDILREGGDDVRPLPLSDRRARLERILEPVRSHAVRLGDYAAGDGRRLHDQAIAKGWEGLVVKAADSIYESGRRSHAWRKLKLTKQQEFVVGGWTDPRQTRAYFGALLLGAYVPGNAPREKRELRYAGHTGTGFTHHELGRVHALLEKLKTEVCPFSVRPATNERPHWVRPELVVQVRFTGWTDEGVLRHPVYLGLRDDIDPRKVTIEPSSAAESDGDGDAADAAHRAGASAPASRVSASSRSKPMADLESRSRSDSKSGPSTLGRATGSHSNANADSESDSRSRSKARARPSDRMSRTRSESIADLEPGSDSSPSSSSSVKRKVERHSTSGSESASPSSTLAAHAAERALSRRATPAARVTPTARVAPRARVTSRAPATPSSVGGRRKSAPDAKTRAALRKIADELRALEDARRDGTIELPDGSMLDVTNLSKVFWPDERLTKGDLLRYYVQISPWLLRAVEDRPLVMRRFPNGVKGKAFYQQRAPDDVPEGVRVELVEDEGEESGVMPRLVGGSLTTLLYMAQLAAISQDPWFSRVQSPGYADYAAIDLDPMPGVPFSQVLEVARAVHEELETLGIPACPKTSGVSGMHVYIPLPPETTYETGQLLCHVVAAIVTAKHRRIATIERAVAKRGRTVYVDYLQNIEGKTLATAYSARASEFAGVSTPLTWEEVHDGIAPQDFTLRTAPARFERVGDLWSTVVSGTSVDLESVLARLAKFSQ